MAERKQTSSPKRKPAAKRTPKKKASAPDRETVKETVERVAPHEEVDEQTKRQAKLTTYTALKSAGLPIPPDIKSEVEGWIKEEEQRRKHEEGERRKRQAAVDKENQKGPWYVRNGYPAPFALRLDRQTEKRRLELKARGEPGDLHPLQKEDLEDPNLKRNLALRIIEIVPASEANKIIEKQTHNSGRRVHTPIALLRNEQGKPYAEDAIRVEAEYNRQGVTVAVPTPGQLQGQVTDKEVGSNRSFGGVHRVQPGQQPQEVASAFVPTGDQPTSIQHARVAPQDAQAKIADDLARRTGVQGRPEDVMGLQVVVDPVQHD